MKHTPGPWNVDTVKTQIGICHKIGSDQWPKREAFGGPKIVYACVYDDGGSLAHPRPVELANARLIAAAPELLAALKQMVASAYPHPVEHPTMTAAWAVANAAIAKAEGRQ